MTHYRTTLKHAAKHASRLASLAAVGLLFTACTDKTDDSEPVTYEVVRPTNAPASADPHAGHDHGPDEPHPVAADPHAGHDHGPDEPHPAASVTPPPPKTMQMTEDLPPPSGARADYAWTLPAGWQEVAGSGMRMATLDVGDEAIDGSVVEMGGRAGGLLPNVNRWRRELGLPPTDQATVEAEAQTPPDAKMPGILWIAIASDDAQTLAAIIPTGDAMLFIKLRGPRAAVAAQQPAFLTYIASIHPAK